MDEHGNVSPSDCNFSLLYELESPESDDAPKFSVEKMLSLIDQIWLVVAFVKFFVRIITNANPCWEWSFFTGGHLVAYRAIHWQGTLSDCNYYPKSHVCNRGISCSCQADIQHAAVLQRLQNKPWHSDMFASSTIGELLRPTYSKSIVSF